MIGAPILKPFTFSENLEGVTVTPAALLPLYLEELSLSVW